MCDNMNPNFNRPEPVSGGVPEPAECELEAIAALLQSAENYRAATWAGPSYANVARWLYDRGVRIQEVRVGGVPEQGPQVYPDLTDEQIEEIARILDEPQLKRLHGAILALSLRYVAAVQEAPRAIRQLRAALERPRPALTSDATTYPRLEPLRNEDMPDREWTDLEWVRNQWYLADEHWKEVQADYDGALKEIAQLEQNVQDARAALPAEHAPRGDCGAHAAIYGRARNHHRSRRRW